MPSIDPPQPRPVWQAPVPMAQCSVADDGNEFWGYEAAMPYLLMRVPSPGDERAAAGPTGQHP